MKAEELHKTKENEAEHKHSGAEGLFGTMEWLLVAFAGTLVFIVFEMQAYTIPTGSMADTLKGAHFRLRCVQCGYKYDYDFLPQYYRLDRNVTPGVNVPVVPAGSRCPSCGYSRQSAERVPVTKGDRIFVLKCIYQFFEPKRWDVIVFKNPLNPRENYIKRLIGLPGETIEIVDGDIFIDDKIARKPDRVQEELWMPVYDNDYQPVDPEAGNFNGGAWRQPFANGTESNWDQESEGGTRFDLEGAGDEIHTLYYDTRTGNDFRATYAYDDVRSYPSMPICSDLMVRFDVANADGAGTVGAGLTKYGIEYKGWVDFSGRMRIEKVHSNGLIEELVGKDLEPGESVGAKLFRFANVDHVLKLEFGDAKIEYDLGEGRGDLGARTKKMPRATIFGKGGLKLRHVALYRDMHYISSKGRNGERILRADEGDPFVLEADQFFVLGDNSPASLDCRWWDEPGKGNSGHEYREGTVPRDYLVGKAFFVYWPGPFKPFNDSGVAKLMERNGLGKILKIFMNIPWPDGMKLIDGGV